MPLAQGRATNLDRLLAKRLGLGVTAHRVVQQRQVVEVDGDGGVVRAVRRLVDGQARRIKGSASPSRFVACNSDARLLRRRATVGWSGP